MFKLKTQDPAKYQALSKGELVDKIVRRDAQELNEKWMTKQQESRVIRMGATAGASFLTGLLYEVKPSLESIAGTPASLDHLLALGGAVGAYLVEDPEAADALEGIANAGMAPLLRGMGRKVGGLLPV